MVENTHTHTQKKMFVCGGVIISLGT